jgi:mRNA-degrading endonuclease YafQ of YafQ-DinJ toxin-antitoxin module
MNTNGDLRPLYRYDSEEVVIFALIGTHSELYG